MNKLILTTAAVIGLLAGGASIQASAAPAAAPAASKDCPAGQTCDTKKAAHHGHHGVKHRAANQQKRIDAGVKKGTLTPAEAGKDESHVAKIDAKAKADAAANGGKLTAGEKAHLNKKLDKNSKAIHDQKTDDKSGADNQDGTNQ